MTLTNFEGEEQEPLRYISGARKQLTEWADDAIAARQIAEGIALTSFCPEAYRKSAAYLKQQTGQEIGVIVANQLTAAMLTGQTLGLDPMQSFAAIDIINGRPALNALAMRALVQAAGHDIWTVKETDEEVTIAGRRRGSENVETSTWDKRRAQRAGLLDKDNWVNYMQDMLVARATSAVCRRVAPDVLLGLNYSAEELSDLEEAPKPRRKTAQRAQAQTPELPGPDAQPKAEPPPGQSTEPPELPVAATHDRREHGGNGHAGPGDEIEPARTARRRETPPPAAPETHEEPQSVVGETIAKLRQKLDEVRGSLTEDQWAKVIKYAEDTKARSDSPTGVASVLAFAERLLVEDSQEVDEPAAEPEATTPPDEPQESAPAVPATLGSADEDDPWAGV